jgi:hypothetical protein
VPCTGLHWQAGTSFGLGMDFQKIFRGFIANGRDRHVIGLLQCLVKQGSRLALGETRRPKESDIHRRPRAPTGNQNFSQGTQ